MALHADMGVVFASFRGGEEDQGRLKPGCLVGAADQLAANAAPLIGLVDG
jgi:hypothetical protein